MPPRRPPHDPNQNANRTIRFADDPGLTFVHYDAENREGSGYRQEARLHNAHRRSSRPTRSSRGPITPAQSTQPRAQMIAAQPGTLIDPLTTYGRDPFSQDVLIPPQNLEAIWRSIFVDYFYLPPLSDPALGLLNPTDVFLNVARESRDLYRTLVVQAVITTEVNRGNQPGDAVFRNQALVIRDFRRLVDLYDNPSKLLSKEQFVHVFASAFSMSGHGFNQQAAYDAITFVNSLFMMVPQNRALAQTEVTDWIRMLMPYPGPTFNRTEAFQLDMLKKVNLTLGFLERMRGNVNDKFPDQIIRYMTPDTALYRVVTTRLPESNLREPHQGFYSICLHRLLALLHTYFEYLCDTLPIEIDRFLSLLEASAANCVQNPPQHCITLFLWNLIIITVDTPLNNDVQEQLFAWAMKDIYPMHLSFVDEMAAWFVQRCSSEDMTERSTPNFDEIRERMREHYDASYVRPTNRP